ncbi:MAG: 30S ribosomal protein S6, partial [bacterium]|nr:30S ribosomal protein S6 [bacterium]
MSQKYELMVIISGKISDREVEERLKGLKEALGPSLTFEEIWGLRSLAYPIKKQSKGHYAVWNFISNAEALKELEGELKHFPDLLRYLLVTVPENYTPITLAQVEAGLEKLRAEKEEKRGAKNAQSQNRPARPERTPPQLAP